MELPEAVRPFWDAFVATSGGAATSRFYEAFHFDDNEPSANELADLVLSGVKRATACLVWIYEARRTDSAAGRPERGHPVGWPARVRDRDDARGDPGDRFEVVHRA